MPVPPDVSRDSLHAGRGYRSVRLQQGRIVTDADWNEQADLLAGSVQALARAVFGAHSASPDAPENSFRVHDPVSVDGLLRVKLDPGDYWIDGLLLHNAHARDFAFDLSAHGGGTLLLYLDAWAQDVDAFLDPSMADPALPVAPSTRTRLAWTVGSCEVDPGAQLDAVLARRDRGTLRVRLADSGYTGLENRLYRIEILVDAADTAAPSFGWSRDNASRWLAVRSIQPGQSAHHWLAAIVPIQDQRALPARGSWLRLMGGDEDSRQCWLQMLTARPDGVLELRGALTDPAGWSLSPCRLQCWDHAGSTPEEGADPHTPAGSIPLRPGEWHPLESGIGICFGPGSYRAGDYWLLPARAEPAGLEGLAPGGTGPACPSHGPWRGRAPLALVSSPGTGTVEIRDLRMRTRLAREPVSDD